MISKKTWDKYKSKINSFINNDSGKQTIIWAKSLAQILPFGEDSGNKYIKIYLDVLVNYNYFKTWPYNNVTNSGEIDNTSFAIYCSKDQLLNMGYLNDDGYWELDSSLDKFIVNGKLYRVSGDTQVAQANNDPLLFMVILKRENDDQLSTVLNSLISN